MVALELLYFGRVAVEANIEVFVEVLLLEDFEHMV